MKRLLALLTLLIVLPGAAAAYTIYLHDGNKIIARKEFRIDGDRALIVLPNGTQTALKLDEIDLEHTRAANQEAYGTALVLEDATLTDVTTPVETDDGPETLGDLIAIGKAGPRTRPSARRPEPAPEVAEATVAPRPTKTSTRREHEDLVLVSEILKAFRAQGLPDVQVFQGERSDRPLVEIITDSEAAVFRALETAAPLLMQLLDSFPGQSEALTLDLVTARGNDAGRFVFDRQSASELIDHQVDVSAFYVRRVIF